MAQAAWVWSSRAAVVVVLVTCVLALFDEGEFDNEFGLVPAGPADDGQRVLLSHYEQITWKCGLATRRFGLTHREQEVIEFLVQGFTMADVAERLYLSPGTVKTHTIHIYRKMGVHSREEMADIVEGMG